MKRAKYSLLLSRDVNDRQHWSKKRYLVIKRPDLGHLYCFKRQISTLFFRHKKTIFIIFLGDFNYLMDRF